MPILSSKRQITLPKELCDRLEVSPGDDLDILEYQGVITILKKHKDGSVGILKHLRADPKVSDEDSLQDSLAKRHRGIGTRRRPR